MAWAVYVQDLLFSLKRDFKYFNFALGHNVKPLSPVAFLEDKLAFVYGQFIGQTGKGLTLVFCQS